VLSYRPESRESNGRRKVNDALTLVVLGAFAVSQPILSDFRAGAGYFLARRAEPIEIVVLVVLLTFLPGIIANVMVWAADAFSERSRRVVQELFVGLFGALIAQSILVRLFAAHWGVLMACSAVIGVGGALAFHYWPTFRKFLTYLIPAPILFIALFLFTPPVSALVLPDPEARHSIGTSLTTPVVFVIFDEFPVASLLDSGGGIDADRYPNFARLAATSTWYKYTAAAHDYTWWAVPALLTGQVPDTSRLPTAANYPGSLFSLFDDPVDLHVVEPFTRLCSPDVCDDREPSSSDDRLSTMARDTIRLYDMMLRPDAQRSAAFTDPFNEFGAGAAALFEGAPVDRVALFKRFLNGLEPGGGLHFVHLLLPHGPFSYYPSGGQYNSGRSMDGLESDRWTDSIQTDQAHQRHLLQIQAMDGLLGQMLNRLKGTGMLDDALVVVAADHGLSFRDGEPSRAITSENSHDIGMVPLFIKAPGQAQGVVDLRSVSTIDVLPTVADHLDVELPWETDGRSLLDPGGRRELVVEARSGGQVVIARPAEGIRETVDGVYSLFGIDEGGLDLYSIGDYDSLLGSSTVAVPTSASELVGAVDEEWRFAHVAPSLGFVPGFLHGQINGDLNNRKHVAVAVNGVLRAVVPMFDLHEGGAKFDVILPEESFVSGYNRLELFTVSGSSTDPIVESIKLEQESSFRLLRGENGDVVSVADSTGASWKLADRDTIRGAVDEAFWEMSDFDRSSLEDLNVAGWAVDEVSRRPAERVIFFVNGVFAGSTRLNIDRPDMQEAYQSDDMLVSGFRGRLSQFLPVSSLDLRAYALSGDFAAEIPLTDDALADIRSG
jgi:hypothetical protein